MSELHKFLFDGLPVRGMLVRLTDSWQEILKRRQAAGAYPAEVTHLLGEMTAAGALMQSNIKFNGALVLQVFGDGPVKLAVAEVQPDLSLRATATVTGPIEPGSSLSQLVNVNNEGRCAITLDPKSKLPGQQAYQGVVPLFGDQREKLENLSEVLEHYMLQSEQLDTKLILAADGNMAAGLLIQRLPVKGQGNLEGRIDRNANEDQIGRDFDRAENYLSLVGLVIVILGGIAVSSVTRVFILQKIRSIAVLKCVGARSRQIVTIYVLQVILLGFAGIGEHFSYGKLTAPRVRWAHELAMAKGFIIDERML